MIDKCVNGMPSTPMHDCLFCLFVLFQEKYTKEIEY